MNTKMVEEPDKIANVCRAYGLRHFASRYGIGAADIREFSRKHQVDLTESEIRDEVVDWVDTGHGKLPFFEEIRDDVLVERKDDRIKVNFDVFHAVGKILGGHLEKLSVEDRVKIVKTPFLDIYEQVLFDVIKEQFKLETKPYWPENKNFSVCLTHDVDEVRKTYQYFTRPLLHLKRLELSRALYHLRSFFVDIFQGNNPYWTFEDLMKLEDKLGVKSSFYFLQEDGKPSLFNPASWSVYGRRYSFNDPRVVEVIKKLSAGGWEVGLHGSFYSYMNLDKLRSDKKDLEKILGEVVTGIRQHHLNLKIPDTWAYHEQVGLSYDTSLGLKDDIGFRWGTCLPFFPLDLKSGKLLKILEIPLVVMDTPLFTKKDNSLSRIKKLIEVVEKQKGVLTVLFHHSVFDEGEYPGWSERYRKLIGLCKEKNAWITTANEVNSWWRSRENGD